jgi:hypothetical protein
MPRALLERAERAVPAQDSSSYRDGVRRAGYLPDEDRVHLSVRYDSCLAPHQLEQIRATGGLELESVHPGDGESVIAHFLYHPAEDTA